MFKKYDSHMHFNMKVGDIIGDFKRQVYNLEGFILILNTEKEKKIFLNDFMEEFKYLFPKSAIAVNYKIINFNFIKKLKDRHIKFGVKLHPRLSGITKNDFNSINENLKNIDFNFIIIDCFYYGSKIETHINLDLSVFIASNFKNINILLAHGGGHKTLEFMLYTRELKNIYYDFSFTVKYLYDSSVWIDIQKAFKYNYKRILFGSDYPDVTVNEAQFYYNKLIENLEFEKERELFYNKNFEEFMEL